MKEREKLSSRLGFILLSAGCAIGLGNVWRFPYITGVYGGGAFVLLYLFFLVILGLPIVVMEFAVGRASQKSIALSFNELEPKGSKWHIYRYFGMAGNYLLMMFYTTIAGWMIAYFVKMLKGDFVSKSPAEVENVFRTLTSNTGQMIFWMFLVVLLGFLVCSFGLQKGVEKITKWMMISLLAIMIVIVVRALTLPRAIEGIKFYLLPDFSRMIEAGLSDTIFAAMGQSFFTLSLGIGALAIFGSFIDKKQRLLGEAINVTVLDTAVALLAGLMIFPSCFSFGVEPNSGPGLVFITLPNVFNEMPAGRLWGTLFFLFLSFAALTTIIAVFQNILTFAQELWGWSLEKSVWFNGVLIFLLSLPCILGMTVLQDVQILGGNIMDFEDFLVSNNLLPLGSLIYVIFCTSRYGWGFKNFLKEANTGEGISFPKQIRFYVAFVIPVIVLFIFIQGYWALFTK